MESNSFLEAKRHIFIWDIHWCFDEFMLLLEKLKITIKDKIYLTGDLINKWPKSYDTLKFVYENRNRFFCVMWNHENWFLKWLKWNIKTKNNKETFLDLKEKLDLEPHLMDFVKDLPLYIDKENFLLLHWWIIPWKDLEEHIADEITELREYEWKAWYEYYKWDKKIIYGHWALGWLNIRDNTIWLDSWCVYWWYLSAYILETGELIKQKALKTYKEIKV